VSGRCLAAVTGANGFLGRHIVGALGEAGWDVRVLVRAGSARPTWGPEIEVVTGALADADALERLCVGAKAVFHVAGLVKARSRAEFQAVNVEGARRLAEAAARKAPQAHVVLVSSLAAREPRLSAYAASKRAGELAAEQVLGPQLTVARPAAVYGPGDRETLRLFRAAARSPLLPTFDPRARLALVHVEDAARQIVELAAGAPGRSVAVCDGRPEGYAWAEVLGLAARACGRRAALVRVPRPVMLALAATAEGAVRLQGGAPMLTRGKARELLHPDWSIAPAELAPERAAPRYDLSRGLEHTIEWYRRAGWLVVR
jgi:nucleoside-diphosphate-sugar epimerase